MEENDHPTVPNGQGTEVEFSLLSPRIHESRFPGMQIVGYLLSLILTFIAFAMVHGRWLSLNAMITVILILAFIQGALQLGIFMHLKEGRGTLWHLPELALAFFVALGIIGFSIWIMMFKYGVS